MYIFATNIIDQVKGKIRFFKLKINGRCEFDEFTELLERRKDDSKLKTIFAIMESVSNLNRLPKTKFRELEGRATGDTIKDYEIKKKPYRVYLFKYEEGFIVVFGSKKASQKKDIKRLRQIKDEYIKSRKYDYQG